MARQDPAFVFEKQTEALHLTVRMANLHDIQKRECLAVCEKMQSALNLTLLLTNMLDTKSPLVDADIPTTLGWLGTKLAEIEACRLLIKALRLKLP